MISNSYVGLAMVILGLLLIGAKWLLLLALEYYRNIITGQGAVKMTTSLLT
jgi:hypothetical protein